MLILFFTTVAMIHMGAEISTKDIGCGVNKDQVHILISELVIRTGFDLFQVVL